MLNIILEDGAVYLNFYYDGERSKAVLKNPGLLSGNLMTGAEIKIILHKDTNEAELVLDEDDFLPDALCTILEESPPAYSTFFGLISEPRAGRGRYYMLRDINADGLLFCTGSYLVKKGQGLCSRFDGQWHLRYNLVENFFYAPDHIESDIKLWKHPSMRLADIGENIGMKDLTKRFRNYAALWHRHNFFDSDDWSKEFYRKQAKLGFIAITHTEDGKTSLTPQLQREYALLDWNNLNPGSHVKKILKSSRIEDENIRLHISGDPSAALENLALMWDPTWITEKYEHLIKGIAADCSRKKDRRFRIWGVTLTAGPRDEVIAGELGYSIGKTYTSLSGFFHRSEKKYNNFGKLQMVMLAHLLEKSGIAFWNLGQPYMEYKLKLGAEVVPRGLFFKRWDKAIRGRTPDLEKCVMNNLNSRFTVGAVDNTVDS